MDTIKVNTAELTDEQREAADTLAGWKNYLFEATMSDYSVSTIERAENGRDAAEEALEALGIDPETAVVWSDARGCWTVA